MSAGAAFDAELAKLLSAQRARPQWSEADGPLPVLFISHGAPPLFDDASWMAQLAAWADSLPAPRAVVIVSAHWESAPLMVSSSAPAPPLVYDFSGFDPRFFSMTYPTADASALAARLASLMPDGEELFQHPSRGLDHGAWVPLKVMFPLAHFPVLQLSLPSRSPEALLALGSRLAQLRSEGVLLIGSGFLTHGLPFLTREDFAGISVPSWSSDFDAWAADALARGDVDALSSYCSSAPGMPYAHPTVEHFTPLLFALGAASSPVPCRTPVEGFAWGLSRRSVELR